MPWEHATDTLDGIDEFTSGEIEPAPGVPEDGKGPAPDASEWRGFVRLAIGEFALRNFYVARLFFPYRSRLNILVTNLRVILYGVGGRGLFGRSRLVQEVHLDRIIGVESFIGWGINFVLLLLGSLFLIGGVLPYTDLVPVLSRLATPRLAIVWYSLIAVGVALIILCFRQLFYVIVKPMAVSQDLTVSARRGFGWSAQRSLVFGQKPGRDATALVRDLGAVILDAQNGEGTPEPPSFRYPPGMEPEGRPDSDMGIPGFETGARAGGLPSHFGYEVSRSGEDE